MDPATIAAIASIGGAAIDFFSGDRAARKARKHTKQVATDEAYGSVMGRVDAAKAAGLHPLAALGVPSSSGANSGGGLTDFRSVGSEIGNAYSQQRQWRAEREFQESQQRAANSARINQEMMDKARLNADLAMAKKQMDFIDEQIRSSQEESLRRSLQSTKPLRVEVPQPPKNPAIPNQYVPVRDRQGNVHYIPNPEIYDLELPTIVGAGTLVKPEIPASTNSFLDTIRQKGQDYMQQRRQLNARDRRLNPYGLPTPIGD